MTLFPNPDLVPPAADTVRQPQYLIVPGLNDSGPDHWQSRWERTRDDCHRVDLSLWNAPNRNSWVNRLNLAVLQSARPTILVAHSLGCMAVAWWAAMEKPDQAGPVVGALLVAPPEVDSGIADTRLAAFAPAPRGLLPFPSILVASRNDPYISFDRARRLASFWGSRFADAGSIGHINAESDIGDWDFGQFLLGQVAPSAAGGTGVASRSRAMHDYPAPTEFAAAAL